MSSDSKENIDVGGGVIYNALEKNYYYWNTVYYNYSQPKTKITEDKAGLPVTGSEVIDKNVGSAVNVIGLLAALVVSLVIIVGVAFVIRTIRKHRASNEDHNSSQVAESKPDVVVATISKDTDQEDNQTSFTLTFTEIPNEDGKFSKWVPKILRPKPKKVDVERLKKELGQIYVY